MSTTLRGARKALIVSMALASLFTGYASACSLHTGTTKPTTPTTSTSSDSTSGVVVTTKFNSFTSSDWLKGIWRKSAGFSIPGSSDNQAAFKVGASVKFADGQVRKITRVYVVGSNMSVFVDGAVLDGNKVGYPRTLSVVTGSAASKTTASTGTSSGTTASKTTSTAPATADTSTAASGTVLTSKLNNFTNSDWLNGVWRKSPGVSLPATAANKAAFKKGASVKLADGVKRSITAVYLSGSNMSVYMNGSAVSGSAVGYPKTIAVVN